MAKKKFRITSGSGDAKPPKKTIQLGKGKAQPVEESTDMTPPAEEPNPLPSAGTPPRKPYLWYGLTALFALIAALGWFWPRQNTQTAVVQVAKAGPEPLACSSNSRYGFDLNQYHARGAVVREGTNLRKTLVRSQVPSQLLTQMSRISDPNVFSWDIPKTGDQVLILANKEDPSEIQHVIVELRFPRYARFDLQDTVAVGVYSGTPQTLLETRAGIVKNEHLWESVLNGTCNYELIGKMEAALKWAVDFYHVETGDRYKLLYERQVSPDGRSEIGQLLGVHFEQWDEDYYAFFYEGENGERMGYFDEDARPMERAFLKSPLKYGRITSPYGTRFHPIDGVEKTHFGTDYAAPEGTPILAVADGSVIIADDIPDNGNGNYVKIKHDQTYQSQYLHMSRLAAGLRRGSPVKQGQVIGYVGSTGKATGPHVCFRFWKNNQQIDHLKENLPNKQPMPEQQAEAYYPHMEKYKKMLDEISVY